MTGHDKREWWGDVPGKLSAKSAMAVWIAGSVAGWAVIILAIVAVT